MNTKLSISQKKKIMVIILITGIFCIAAGISANDARIIDVIGAPLIISSYDVSYQEDGRYVREGIRHEVTLHNSGEQNVVAYTIGLQAFDAFNRNMGRPLGGVSINTISVGEEESGAWLQRPSAAFTFQKYGTGVAYVRLVRLDDGTIWEADMEFVLRELQKIEGELSLEDIIPE